MYSNSKADIADISSNEYQWISRISVGKRKCDINCFPIAPGVSTIASETGKKNTFNQ